MDTARWERVQDLFHRAAEMPADRWPVFLDRECGTDPGLRADVLAMLEEDSRLDSLVDEDLGRVAHRVMTEDARALPEQDFGPYRAVRFLGEGGMGVVFLAERRDLGSTVALKILRDAWLSPARRERFESEQRTLARFDHPSIARLLDAGALPDGTPWIAMEYVDGLPITNYCNEHRCATEERLRLFREVCEAVEHTHRHAIIHRDLKPSNVLVRHDGSIKLLDFGIAKSLEGVRSDDQRTRTQWSLVTPAYAAPEQTRGGPLGVHTDVYALGVILHELLTGQLPSGRPPSAVAARPPGADRRLPRTAAEDLDLLCRKALEEDPDRRYATAGHLIRDVDHFLAGEPLDARPDSASYRMRKFAGRHRVGLSVATAVVGLAVAAAAFHGARLTAARNAAVAEAERAQRIQRFMLSLFKGEEAAPPESLRVMTLLDRGRAEAALLDAEPAVQAELLQSLGEIQLELGRLDDADSLLSLSLRRRESHLPSPHPDIARGRIALGLLRMNQARYDEAERLVRDGLEITDRTLPRRHPDVVRARVALGEVLEAQGRYDEAIEVLERARALAPGLDDLDLASVLHALANVRFYAGDYGASDSLNVAVLEILRPRLGDRHPALADNLINLGASRAQLGKPAEAERQYRDALAITRAWYGDEHPKTATNRTMLGRSLVAQGRADEALQELEQALAVLEAVHGPVHPRVASALNEVATVALQRGEFDDAEAAFGRMADIYREVHGESHDLFGVAQSNLASVAMARGDWSRAESLLAQVVALFTDTLPADHLNLGIARIKHGRTLLRLGRFADAVRESDAGRQVLERLGDDTSSWVRAARADLQAAQDSLSVP